ncbi:DUF2309 domain-containing protein [Candidatus Nitronereus thalassa]|uniref:Probable inorganic carbon transporter subunit DabA n=1 Tax=Candidatus Nitronereus thalassa TaxID=3020898 RepID=A0ABU3KAF0_9BACT|nr:DUF2309 domain-containing protein [Candidatus Nitronereus thalassa]MDT7043369.1 DUF2309 domain-containing protein [Candidatus Nitronereus thalassa]
MISHDERDHLRVAITKASELIAPFWPMRTMIAQNPIHGLEYLPFDEAVRQGQQFLAGRGYLPNEEYRQFFHKGRIRFQDLQQALARVRPESEDQGIIKVGSRQVTVSDVWLSHLIFEFVALEPVLLPWELSEDGSTKRFRQDLPTDSRKRIIARTIEECEHCRDFPEKAYLINLWKSILAVLGFSSAAPGELSFSKSSDFPEEIHMALPAQQTLSDWVGKLAGVGLVEQINQQMIKWIAGFLDEGLAGWEMGLRESGFYSAWRELASRDHTGRFLGIQGFTKKVQALPLDPEEAIVWGLQRLGIHPTQWQAYISRLLSQLPGWTRYIRWLGEHPEYPAQKKYPIDPIQYLAMRLFYEVECTQVVCQQEWGIDGILPAVSGYWNARRDDYAIRMGKGLYSSDPTKQAICRDAWRLFHLAQCMEWSPIDVQGLSLLEGQKLLNWLDAFPPDQHGPVWLEAYEGGFRKDLLQKLFAHQGIVSPLDIRPKAQLVFCIDVRSESFRRHIEAQGPYETFGFAGFFGIPISHQGFDHEGWSDLCPVLLSPNHAVKELPRSGEEQSLQQYLTGTRWRQLGDHVFRDLKQNPLGSLMVIDVFGLFFSLGLVGKTLLLKPYRAVKAKIHRWFTFPVSTLIEVASSKASSDCQEEEVSLQEIPSGRARGFSTDERATFIENGLRAMGLTKNFGRLVVLCGHGSETDNNPYFGALDCGACGGNPGDANARVFASMANDPEVRHILKEKGLPIPDDTWFLPGKHNTTTDRVTFYDLEELPQSHQADIAALHQDLESAGAHQALERCQRIPSAPTKISPEKAFAHVAGRSGDWANPRPEWGLAGNAAFLIGRRKLTKGLDLGGRVFLHSYDPLADPEGAILEKIMTAPLIVGEWINTGYYFSGVDPWAYGSGSKVIHNVVGGVGVMLGSQSDLQMGFPLQTVNNGDIHYHEPMRLLAIIEHHPSVISSTIQKHQILQQLFHNQWLNLIALDPHTSEFHRYNPDASWEFLKVVVSN